MQLAESRGAKVSVPFPSSPRKVLNCLRDIYMETTCNFFLGLPKLSNHSLQISYTA